jgi:uncharacterized membrane protein
MKLQKVILLTLAVAALSVPCEGAVPVTEPALPGQASTAAHNPVGERIAGALRKAGLPDELVVMLISALPIVELRGAVPVGHLFKMNPWLVYFLAVLGNMLPIPFILLLLGPLSKFCMQFKLGRAFFEWLFARTRRKSVQIEKYETLGLTIFVAIPLPATGGWTGAMAAFLMGMSFRHAMLSILLGVMIAGVIMTVLSLMGWLGAIIATVALIGMVVSGLWAWLKRENAPAAAPH